MAAIARKPILKLHGKRAETGRLAVLNEQLKMSLKPIQISQYRLAHLIPRLGCGTLDTVFGQVTKNRFIDHTLIPTEKNSPQAH